LRHGRKVFCSGRQKIGVFSGIIHLLNDNRHPLNGFQRVLPRIRRQQSLADFRQQSPSILSCNQQLACFRGPVEKLHPVGNNEAVEMLDDFRGLPWRGIQDQPIGLNPHQYVSDCLPLVVCQEGLAPLAHRQPFDVIRAEAVQELHPVRPGDPHPGAAG